MLLSLSKAIEIHLNQLHTLEKDCYSLNVTFKDAIYQFTIAFVGWEIETFDANNDQRQIQILFDNLYKHDISSLEIYEICSQIEQSFLHNEIICEDFKDLSITKILIDADVNYIQFTKTMERED